MGVKPNVVESVISKIKSVIDQQVIVSIVAGYGNDKYEELLPGTHHLTIMPNTPAKVLEGTTLFEKDNTLTAEELNYVQTMFESIGEVYLIENYQKDVGIICLNSSKEGMNMYLHLGFKKKDNYLIYKNG